MDGNVKHLKSTFRIVRQYDSVSAPKFDNAKKLWVPIKHRLSSFDVGKKLKLSGKYVIVFNKVLGMQESLVK